MVTTYNMNCTTEILLDSTKSLFSLVEELIDTETQVKSWIPPDKDSWERIQILSPTDVIIVMGNDLDIPIEYQKPWVSYIKNTFLTTGLVVYSPYSLYINYTHFGIALLHTIIMDNMVKCGIDTQKIVYIDNTILYDDKKICGISSTIRGNYVSERAIFNLNIDLTMMQSLLPEVMFQRATRFETGITSLTSIDPTIEHNTFTMGLKNDCETLEQSWVDGIDDTNVVSSSGSSNIVTTSSVTFFNLDDAKKDKINQLFDYYNKMFGPYLDKVARHRDLQILGLDTILTQDEYVFTLRYIEQMRKFVDVVSNEINACTTTEGVKAVGYALPLFEAYVNTFGWV